MKLYLPIFIYFITLSACQSQQSDQQAQWSADTAGLMQKAYKLDTATFAGGCFWCTEAYFERVEGVHYVVSGYAGGEMPNPTYQQVSAGKTDHAESVQLYYDPEKLSYEDLLKVFFATMDPTQLNRQGPDVGAQYRSVVFYHNKVQQQEAEDYVRQLEASGKYNSPVVTKVEPYHHFYQAESYHQDYYQRNPNDAYVRTVARPKVKKFEKEFQNMLKDEYKK
jgi:peptide-methionine (S)-S-oxide reductase